MKLLSLSLLALVSSFVADASVLRGVPAVEQRKLAGKDFYFLVSHIRENKAWCITAVEGNQEFGNLKLQPCDFEGAPRNQLFYPSGETKIASAFDDKCIAINHGDNLFDGVRARLADCEDTGLNDFAFSGEDDFIQVLVQVSAGNQAGNQEYCLTNVGPDPHPNDFIHAKPCIDRPDYKWTFVPVGSGPPPPPYFLLESGGGCAAPRNTGNEVILRSCNGSNRGWIAKVLAPVPGEESFGIFISERDSNKCLRAGKGNTVQDGTKMRLLPCDETDELQQFVYDGSRFQLNSRPDLCMVYRGTNANVGVDPIILKTCTESQEGWNMVNMA